ncbi:MAG: serine hydrolase, partial [Bacteroidota bacterium]
RILPYKIKQNHLIAFHLNDVSAKFIEETLTRISTNITPDEIIGLKFQSELEDDEAAPFHAEKLAELMNVPQEIISVGNFSKLVVKGKIKVAMSTGGSHQVAILGTDNTSKVKIKNNNGTLTISPKAGFKSEFLYDVEVSAKVIEEVTTRNGAKVFSSDIFKKKNSDLSAVVDEQMKKAGIVGYQTLLIRNGQIVLNHNGGFLKTGEPEQVTEESVFMIASLTKPLYGLAIMKLVDQGLIRLDDPINNYLSVPILNPYSTQKAITFRMLLAHTSSIKDNWEVLSKIYHPNSSIKQELTLNQFISDYFLENGLYYSKDNNFHKNKSATHWDYSNVGYMLLGHLIETITQQKMKDFCQKEIFDPLGMNNTFWYLQDITHENITYPHRIEDGKAIALDHYGYPSFPEGQIRTSVSDYAKFLFLFLNEGIIDGKPFLQSTTIKEFFKVQYPDLNPHQAISWNYNEFGSEEFYNQIRHLPAHTGLEAGATTAAIFDPQERSAVIIFNNTQPNGFEGLLKTMSILAKEAGMSKK